MWSDLGRPPADNEYEVTVLGPGYGESVVVHLGQGQWLVADSCVDTEDPLRGSAPLRYLRTMGATSQQAVRYIVASHWDDDHVRGLDAVVDAYPKARFVASQIFNEHRFHEFVEAMAVGSQATNGANVRTIRNVYRLILERRQPVMHAIVSRELHSHPRIRCWSPSDLDHQDFAQFLLSHIPIAGQSMRKALAPPSANLSSVVVSIEWPETSVLLGADMLHSSDDRRGWAAIARECERLGVVRSDLVKIPHHGSENAHSDWMWDRLLTRYPISVVAPFGRGRIDSRPPTSADIRRIRGLSERVAVTARHSASRKIQKDPAVARCLREGAITMTSRTSPLGLVRHRWSPSDSKWTTELFGPAYRAK